MFFFVRSGTIRSEMARTFLTLILSGLLAFALQAQTSNSTPTATSPAVANSSFLSTLTDANTLVMAGMVASQLADAKTDWHYTVAGKQYTLTPATRLGIAGGIFGATLAIQQAWPKSKKITQIAGSVIMAYFAGRALANTYNHGTADVAPPTAVSTTAVAAPKVAFSVRFRR